MKIIFENTSDLLEMPLEMTHLDPISDNNLK